MLTDKIVLITGASAGIGQACARKFSEAGARVILAARRLEQLEEIAAHLQGPSHLVPLDVRDQRAVEAAIAGLPSEWQAVDILVNNAGLGRGLDKLHEGDPSGWDEMIDTNIKGLLYTSRAVLPGMVERDRGHVINIGSIAGHEVYPGGNVYCATKHAVDAITKGMRIDLVDTPIRVSTIDPGLVETEFSLVRFHGDADRARTVYQGYKPLTGDDIADTAVWIADRPEHVQVAEVIIFPTAQASSAVLHKER
ncbi:SDR family NAD(P)-dependent oxidoreductase [candidate division GN15 bacterium]|nr:SDR family NAD(P)-dependent oxidoreductase [candidate division GN15 bacterium]